MHRDDSLPPFLAAAREEAARRWPNTGPAPTTALARHDSGMASGFVLGAQWARSNTVVTDEMIERGLKVSREFPIRRGLDNARNVMRAVLEAAIAYSDNTERTSS